MKEQHFQNPLVNFSVNRKITISILILIIMVFGGIAFTRLGLDLLPDINYPVVTVVTQYSGASPADIEDQITKPLEGIIASVNRVKKLTSTTSEGISAINVEFEWGTDLDFAAQDIRDQISFVKDYLPADAKDPTIFKFSLGSIPVMFVGVTGKASSYELKKIVQDNICDRLARLEGVASAGIYGGDVREIQVNVDPYKLTARGIGIDQVVNALRAQNLNLPAGYLTKSQTDFLLRAVGEYKNLDDIRKTVIGGTPSGGLVYLADVAEVKDAFKEVRSYNDMNGRQSLFMVITKRSGANTLLTSRRVVKEMEKLKKEFLTEDIEFHQIFDQGKPISRIANSTSRSALEGALLAILFMFLFLRNLRPTLTIAVAIPFSVITTFIALWGVGYTLNMMTLGGIALAVGRLVDDAVVVIENVYRHLQAGEERNEAARRGASEVGMAVTASTLTTIMVFLPIFFATGLAGQLAKGLALTIMISLFASLFVALTIVPMLASVFFAVRKGESVKWTESLALWYRGMLNRVLDYPVRVIAVIFGIILATVAIGAKVLGGEFMPKSDSPMLLLKMELPIGTPLEETKILAEQVRDLFMSFREVQTVGTMVGRNEQDQGGDAAQTSGPHQAQFFVRINDREERKLSSIELTERIRTMLPKSDSIKLTFMDMGMGMGMGSSKPVNIKVFGKDFAVLKDICGRIRDGIKDIEGLRDLEVSVAQGRPEFHFTLNRDKAIPYGLTPYQVENAIQAATLGQVATRYRAGGEEIDVRVWLEKSFRKSLDEIKKIPVKSAQGAVIPLEQICDFSIEQGPVIIQRDNQYRLATVSANVSGRDIRSVTADIQKRIAHINQTLPSGYFVEYGGEYEDMRDAFITLAKALAIAVLLVFMVMAAQFESLIHPLVIMFTMPLALLGVVWAFVFTGTRLSVVTLIGVIMLMGIVVTNGIVFVDFVNQLRRKGMDIREALLTGGSVRLRPILITAGTTIAGMFPMLVKNVEGSELQKPMALTVIGGLVTATVLTLFIIPIVYMWFDRIGVRIKRRFRRIVQKEEH